MKLTKEQRKDMLEAAKPLLEWLNENCHPHCALRVTPSVVELVEGVVTERTDEFLKD